MKKFFLVPAILSFAVIAFAGQADARPGGCVKGAIVGGIVGHFAGHGGIGAAAGCAYGIHRRNGYGGRVAKPAKGDIGEIRHPQRIRARRLNCRLTLSCGQGAALSLTVVLTGLPRTTPCKPMARISRSTVQRATLSPSRSNCRQTLRTP